MVKEGKPVGPRDVTRGLSLSSPSVAYRHLQKLENLGLLQRDTYGEYILREKVAVKGHLWIGRNLVPRLMFYSFFFIGVFSVEVTVIAIRSWFREPIGLDFMFLTLITGLAVILFLLEGILLLLRTRTS